MYRYSTIFFIKLRREFLYNPEIHNRKSHRLTNFNYSNKGSYFITICTHNRANLFGSICNNIMHLNNFGILVNKKYLELQFVYPNITLDAYIIMPNHFHGIITINKSLPNNKNLGNIIGRFKSETTHEYILGVKQNIFPAFDKKIWQRDYNDHLIRNEQSYINIKNYIINNPSLWKNDYYNNLK